MLEVSHFTTITMFWSLVIEPGKRYSSTVKESFHLSMATLDVKTCKNDHDVHPVLIEVDGQELLLCNLSKSVNPHAGLDLIFEKDTEITFSTSGKATIHLTGYCIQEDGDSDDYDNYSSLEEEDESFSELVNANRKSKNTGKQNANKRKLESVDAVSKKKPKGAQSDSDDDEDDDDSDTDLDDSHLDQLVSSVNTEGDSSDGTDDDSDVDDEQGDEEETEDDEADDDSDVDDEEDDDDDDSDASSEDEKPKPKQSMKQEVITPVSNKQKTPLSNKKQDKQQNKSQLTNGTPQSNKKDKNKNQANQQTPKQGNQKTPSKDAQKDKTPKKGDSTPQPQRKLTLSGGVVVEDLKPGNGQPAKQGKMVQVYYTGRLKNNNRVFDKSTDGPGFKFRLGKGEVIRGWDVALEGMKVGGKRRITIPPGMGYGAKGSPPAIPANSWLVFDVEMKSVN